MTPQVRVLVAILMFQILNYVNGNYINGQLNTIQESLNRVNLSANHAWIASLLECGENQFKCRTLGFCIPKSWVIFLQFFMRMSTKSMLFKQVCDGTIDCVDSSDEENCPMDNTRAFCRRNLNQWLNSAITELLNRFESQFSECTANSISRDPTECPSPREKCRPTGTN